MVKKLYVVERAEPDVFLPTVVIAELNDGNAVVEFQGPLVIDIGSEEYNLKYNAQVEAVEATIATEKPNDIGAGWIVSGGLLVFIGGAITGALVFR